AAIGAGKTAAFDAAVWPLLELQAEWERPRIAALDQYQEALTAYVAARKKGTIAPKPAKPTDIQYDCLFQDWTLEALIEASADRRAGLLLGVDETATFFGNMDAFRAHTGRDRPAFLSAFNGQRYSVVRKKQPALAAPCWLVGIVGFTQPEMLPLLVGKI